MNLRHWAGLLRQHSFPRHRHLTYARYSQRTIYSPGGDAHPSSIRIQGQNYPKDEYTNVTSAIISKIPLQLYTKPAHPICTLRNIIQTHFQDYNHLSSLSPLVTPAKNFDELSFPADHPGRSVTDSYYINKDLMLRTHTSAHEVEVFSQGIDKWLLTADVYRRDEIDSSHYPVFHQMEGARLFDMSSSGIADLRELNERLTHELAKENIEMEDLTRITEQNPYQASHNPEHAAAVTANLKLSLSSLLYKLFAGVGGVSKENPLKVRWIEAYFPWTSPSYEVEVLFGGKWLEILGCGVVQQTTLDKAGVPHKLGWAFGLGLERIAMILYSIPDIRLFWSQDERFISQFIPGKITPFRPYSSYPACYKDTSFWLPPEGLHQNDFCDLVRLAAGDLVEDIKLIDTFVHPKTNRKSVCYRINYRSMDRSLSNDEVNQIQDSVKETLKEQFGVEIR